MTSVSRGPLARRIAAVYLKDNPLPPITVDMRHFTANPQQAAYLALPFMDFRPLPSRGEVYQACSCDFSLLEAKQRPSTAIHFSGRRGRLLGGRPVRIWG